MLVLCELSAIGEQGPRILLFLVFIAVCIRGCCQAGLSDNTNALNTTAVQVVITTYCMH